MADFVVRWTGVARDDFIGIVEYIARDSSIDAERIADAIDDAAARLTRFPNRGRKVPELAKMQGTKVRELIITPWRMMYQVKADVVNIVAVVDSRRDLHDWLNEQVGRFKASRA